MTAGPDQRDAEVYRLQRRRSAAPAAAIDLLECERLLDLQFVRHWDTIPAFQRRFCRSRFHIPTRSRAAGCDRTAYRKGGEDDHLDFSRHQRALLRYLLVDLKGAIDRDEIPAAAGRMDLRD